MIETISRATAKNAPKRSSESTPGPNAAAGITCPANTRKITIPIVMIKAPKAIAQYSLLLEPLSFLSASRTGIPSPTDPSTTVTRRRVDKKSTILQQSLPLYQEQRYNNHIACSEYEQVSLCYTGLSCFDKPRE